MKRKERGFALLDLAVVVGISAIIALGAGMTTVQILTGIQRNNDQETAVRQVQNTGYWFSQDLLTSQNVTLGDDLGTGDNEFATLVWKDWESGDTYNTRYIWLNSADSLKKLTRNRVVRDKDYVVISNTTTLVADNIYSANLTLQSGIWQFSVAARSGQRSFSRYYQIVQRVEQ